MSKPGSGVVTTWDDKLVAQARCFSAAHDRRFIRWEPQAAPEIFAEGIDGTESLTIFVSVRQTTASLLDSLARLSVRRELPLGLIPCTPTSQIPLTRPIDPPAPSLPMRSLLYSYFFSLPGVPGVSDIYGRPASEEFLEAAEHGAEVIILHTHGNGADAPVDDAILCARVERGPLSTSLTRCLPCQVDGPCMRERRNARFYFGPSYLRCHALVFLSCTGFPPADSLLQYEASLVEAALRGGMIRSIVTSVRTTGSSNLSLALATKSYLDEGHSMGELALAINHADAEGGPHYVCIGDPQYRPLHGSLAPGPIREIPEPPPGDARRARKAVIALAEAELLAHGSSTWPSIEARIQAVDLLGEIGPQVPVADPPTLVETPDFPIARHTELADGYGRCPTCERTTVRNVWRPVVARGELWLECCGDHGITAVDATPTAEHGEEPAPREARWLFTAFVLRHVAQDVEQQRELALALAHELEQAALSGAANAGRSELDRHIADVLGAAVSGGSELFLSRQQRFLSVSKRGETNRPHHCGHPLRHVDFSSIPARIARRVWFCPLCGVVGNTLREHDLPKVWIDGGHWHAEPPPDPGAADAWALTLAWEPRGLCRDDWSTSVWMNGARAGQLHQTGHERFGGLRCLVGVMVADGEVSTIRVPAYHSLSDQRLYSLPELNDRDAADSPVPWRRG